MKSKKITACLMAAMMTLGMSATAFADSVDKAPVKVDNTKIEQPEQRINVRRTVKLRANTWTEVASANNWVNEDVRIMLENLSGANSIQFRVKKNGNIYISPRSLSMSNPQFTFDTSWNDGTYSVEFLSRSSATVTYRVQTM